MSTAASTTPKRWLNAYRKTATSGSAMERVQTITVVIFFGTWSRQTTKKYRCILNRHSKTHLWSVTYAARKICSCWAIFQQKRKHVSFCCAENHAWAISPRRMTSLILIQQIGCHWLRIKQFSHGLFQSLALLTFKGQQHRGRSHHSNWVNSKNYGNTTQTRNSRILIM